MSVLGSGDQNGSKVIYRIAQMLHFRIRGICIQIRVELRKTRQSIEREISRLGGDKSRSDLKSIVLEDASRKLPEIANILTDQSI
jgi:hypothetical protein